MKRLVDMNNKTEIGFVDWEFIHDMQGIVPSLITPELISLNSAFLQKIPEKWLTIKEMLKGHVSTKHAVFLAIADIENLGNDFKVKGVLQDNNNQPLGYHRAILYDKDRFEDDYLGSVITDKTGEFTLSFGKKVFSDFGLDSQPDIYFKVYKFEAGNFIQIGRVQPKVFEKTVTIEKKTVIQFGVVVV